MRDVKWLVVLSVFSVVIIGLLFLFPETVNGSLFRQEITSTGSSYRTSGIGLDVSVYQPTVSGECAPSFKPPQPLTPNSRVKCRTIADRVVYELYFKDPGVGTLNAEVRVSGNCIIENPSLGVYEYQNLPVNGDGLPSWSSKYKILNPKASTQYGASYSLETSGSSGIKLAGVLKPLDSNGDCTLKVKYSTKEMVEYKAGWLTKAVKTPVTIGKTIYYHSFMVGKALRTYWGLAY